MDDTRTGMPPGDDRLTQAELAQLFPVPDRFGDSVHVAGVADLAGDVASVAGRTPKGFARDSEGQIFPGWWVDAEGNELHGFSVPEAAVTAWRHAVETGAADTADLEWRLSSRGLTRSSVSRQLQMMAGVLESLAVDVRWDPDGMGFEFTRPDRGARRGTPVTGRVGLDQRTTDLPVVRVGDHPDLALMPERQVRTLAAAAICGVDPAAAVEMERLIFVSARGIEAPGWIKAGLGDWGGEMVDRHYRIGGDGERIVVIASDAAFPASGLVDTVYDGVDPDRACDRVREHATEAAAVIAEMERGADAPLDPYAALTEADLAATRDVVSRLDELRDEALPGPRQLDLGM